MPELPEVETTCNGIKPHVVGQRIDNITIRQTKLRWPITPSMASELPGLRIETVTRRGKYILLHAKFGCLIIHLGMSGCLKVANKNTKVNKHDHVDFTLQNQLCLRYTDPRRFGAIIWTKQDPNSHPLLTALGPEPLSLHFSVKYLGLLAAKRKVTIKQLIMNNKVVVGVGNIYAAESLFAAKVHPLRPANTLNDQELESLCKAIKRILKAAIKQGGTTLKDFVGGDGKPGYFKQNLQVYGRAGLACFHCKETLKSTQIGQRSTVYCPECQM